MSDTAEATTTAQLLVNYRNELIAGGIPEDEATFMTRDAAARVIQSKGLQAQAIEK